MSQATYPPRRVAFRVEYDGTGFSGWQKQLNTPNTIQQSLEEAWSAFVGHDVAIQGASRTDAGVHAAAARRSDSPTSRTTRWHD